MPEEIRCLLEAIGMVLIFGFWGLSSRRFGGSVDTSLHPMMGSAGAGVNIFFAVVTLALMLLVIYSNLR